MTNSLQTKTLVNVGCGHIHHKDWINLDIITSDDVVYFNLKDKLPMKDNTVDVVYHSHVLEHLTRSEGVEFIGDCFRVLKPGGIIRVAVPDLEKICSEYLSNLEIAYRSRENKDIQNHYWNTLELFDQTTRTESGGEMIRAIKKGLVNSEYVLKRNGEEMESCFSDQTVEKKENVFFRKIKSFYKKIFSKKFNPQKSGEAHKWMYDRLSLTLLLEKAGFRDVEIRKFDTSYLEDWTKYGLDKSINGNTARKPDSLFVEALK